MSILSPYLTNRIKHVNLTLRMEIYNGGNPDWIPAIGRQ